MANNKNKHILGLLDQAKSLPAAPGCYIMKSSEGEVLYVGKAKSLKSRVVSYFNESSKSTKTLHLVERINSFDFMLVGNEAEALVLENNLIKKHAPRYNIRLRDDKSYPYIVIDRREPSPTLQYLRRVKRESQKVIFGPFPNAGEISQIMTTLIKSLGLRDCSLSEFRSRKEPCLLFQMKHCKAPCTNQISNEEYLENLELAMAFFKGKTKKTIAALEQKMLKAAECEEFEHAAFLRDSINKLSQFLTGREQSLAEMKTEVGNVDIFAYHLGDQEVEVAILLVRNNLLLGSKTFHFPKLDCQEEIPEEFSRFVLQYYSESHDIYPERIIFPKGVQEDDLARHLYRQALSTVMGQEVQFEDEPREKSLKSLVTLAINQASEAQRVRIENQSGPFVGLNYLKEILNLPERPKRLECFDIAIWQGEAPTAGAVVFVEGRPLKQDYRHFHLTERPEGNNDFAFMREAFIKRIESEKGAGEKQNKVPFPDVFLVDGGKGQLNQFLQVMEEFKIQIPVIAIAKEKTKADFKSDAVVKSEERLFIPGRANPLPLKQSLALSKILVAMRDEAHRFSRRLHHHKGRKNRHGAWIDGIAGIGPKTKQKILQKLEGSIQELKEHSIQELKSRFDLTEAQAKSFYDWLHSELSE